ncbi:DUF4249 domain-containing protein [Runella sp.]|uniref:DUF4249 domain-containing protein n=1 Tax=Runella sp. TaxID=1960881 RepID=UPI003D0BF940
MPKLFYSLILLLVLHSCVQPYAPPEITNAGSYLVVDGFLNVNPLAASQIKLSRTQNVNGKESPEAVRGAAVSVEGDKGSNFNFTEAQPGVYTLGKIAYSENENFRLHIKTKDGKEYLSLYVPAMQTPPIESVTYRISPDRKGAQINVNTTDPLNKTHFYRWNFEETWEYQMPLFSGFEVIGKQIKPRTEDVNTCWATRKSSQITVASSVKLSKDVIRDVPITYVPVLGDRLRIKYSILVRQYGVSQKEFEYWNALSRTNEVTGGLFDSQPSQVTGNMSCVSDPNEMVFGFFSASSVEEKRLFITEKLGGRTLLDVSCEPIDTLPDVEAIRMFETASHLILLEFPIPGQIKPWYITGSPGCSDCRELGGTNKRPSFWK